MVPEPQTAIVSRAHDLWSGADFHEIYRWAGIVAARMCRGNRNLWEDIRQEAVIGAWRCLQKHPDATQAYLMASMRNAALSYVVDGTVTGGGRASDGTLTMVRAEVPEVDDAGNSRLEHVEAPPLESGYGPHWSQLMDGLDTTKRDVADLMFANGFTAADAAAFLGMSPAGVGAQRAWVGRHIRNNFAFV